MKMVDVDETEVTSKKPKTKVKKEKVPFKETKLDDNFFPIEDLPSKYKLYPEGTQLYARPLKVAEVKMLSSMTEDNAVYVINDVLRKTVRGYNVSNIYISDKMYLIFWLRANTYTDSGYSIDFDCPLCENSSTYNFGLECLDIMDIKDDYDMEKPVTLPMSKHELLVTQLMIKDENNVNNFIEKNKKTPIKYDIDILSVANLITHINDEETKDLKSKYNYLLEMNPADYAYLESYILHFEMGVNPHMDVTCNECGGNSPMAVSFRSDFFIPKYRF